MIFMRLKNHKTMIKSIYYPNLVMPLDNNEHQKIDDVSTDCGISYDIRSVETMGFAL